MTSTKVTFMTSVDAIVMERYVKKQKDYKRLNFTKECIVIGAISLDFVSGVIAAAAKNKPIYHARNH